MGAAKRAARRALLFAGAAAAAAAIALNVAGVVATGATVRADVSPSPTPDPYAVADALAKSGFRAEALEQLKAALKADPTRSPLPPSLVALVDDPFAEAIALARAGFDDQALAAAKQQVQQHPGATLPPMLSYLNGQPLQGLPLPENTGTKVRIILWDAAALVAAALLLWLVILRSLRRMVTVGVRVAPLDEAEVKDQPKRGAWLAALIEDELRRVRAEGGSDTLEVARTPDAAVAIPEPVKSLPGAAGIFLSLIALLPNRIYTLAGSLLPLSPRGVGLTVSVLDAGGAVVASETLWQKDYDPLYQSATAAADEETTAAYERLAIAAASWAIYQPPLMPKPGPDDTGRDWPSYAPSPLPESPMPRGYVSRSWRSYAKQRVGVRWSDEGDDTRAVRLYEDAVSDDPENCAALLNLAYVQKRDTDGHARRLALLETALRLSSHLALGADDSAAGRASDRSWYRIRFALALAHTEEALRKRRHPAGDGCGEHLRSAEHLAVEVIVRAAEDMRWTAGADASDLNGFLHLAQESAVTLLAGVWALLPSHGLVPAAPVVDALPAPYRGRNDAPDLIAALLESAGGSDGLPRSVRYDLACYYAVAGESASALRELAYGIDTRTEAREDPAFRALRRDKLRARFEHVVQRWGRDK